jgi:peroxiredoxin
LNVQLLGISDSLPFSQKAFADSLQLPYPLLSDVKLNATKAYGVMYNPEVEGSGVKRAFFLMDQQGIVRGRWIGEDSAVFSSEVLLKAAQEIVGKPADDTGAKKPRAM